MWMENYHSASGPDLDWIQPPSQEDSVPKKMDAKKILVSKYRELRNNYKGLKNSQEKSVGTFQNSSNALAKFKDRNSSAYLIQGPSTSQVTAPGPGSREGR